MVLQESSCVESAHHRSELLNNRLTNQLLHVTEYERSFMCHMCHALRWRNSLS